MKRQRNTTYLLHNRNKLELQLDRYNHIMELIRTISSLVAAIGTLLVLWKLFGG